MAPQCNAAVLTGSSTFYDVDLGEREVDGLSHAFDIRLQLSFRQRGELIEQRGDVVGVDGHQYLDVVEGEREECVV